MLFSRPRSIDSAPTGNQAPALPLWRPEAQLGTDLSRASQLVMPNLEMLHDRELFESGVIPEGHPSFPNGGSYRITNYYDRVQFSTRTGTGAWLVTYEPRGSEKPVKLGAFATTKVKHVYGYFGDPEDRDSVIATMVTGRGGNLVPDIREDVVEREVQVVAILGLFAERLEQERAANVAAGIGAVAVPEAA